jgi:hypothetical protein
VRAQDDQCRAIRLGHARAERGFERVEVFSCFADLQDVPVVRAEPRRDVVAVRERGVAVDRDVVVVVDEHEPAEPEVPRERSGLVADAFHEVAVAADPEDVVVAQIGAEARAEVLLGDGHPDRVPEPLPERARRDLDAPGVPLLRVTRRLRAPLPELAEILELETEPGEVQHRVEEHRRVPGREDEAVAVRPVAVGGVVRHDPREEHVRERRQRHRRPGVPRVRALDGVHREPAHHIDGAAFEVPVVGHPGPFLPRGVLNGASLSAR